MPPAYLGTLPLLPAVPQGSSQGAVGFIRLFHIQDDFPASLWTWPDAERLSVLAAAADGEVSC